MDGEEFRHPFRVISIEPEYNYILSARSARKEFSESHRVAGSSSRAGDDRNMAPLSRFGKYACGCIHQCFFVTLEICECTE